MSDRHRISSSDYHTRVRRLADQREELVCNHFAARGYSVLSWGDNEHSTRTVFDMPKTGSKAADIVAQVSSSHAIIAEVKGSEFDKAIRQLQSTVPFVRKRFAHISCKVFTSTPVPAGDTFLLPGGHFSAQGYRAIRIFHAGFPGEWLVEVLKDGRSQSLRLGDENVAVVFGPYRPPELP